MTNHTNRDTLYTSNNEPLGDKMPIVFQLFTDLKEAKQFCYNHNMKDVDRLVLTKCNIHKDDVYYVIDGASFKHGDLNLQTVCVYE